MIDAIISDISQNAELSRLFRTDSRLSVDDFADKHTNTVKEFCGRGGYQLDYETAHQAACRIWRKFRES